MLILSVDTTATVCSAALRRDGKTLHGEFRKHSQRYAAAHDRAASEILQCGS